MIFSDPGLHSRLHSGTPEKLYGASTLGSFKVIQGHRNCYQLKAHMRLPISLPL